MDKGLRDELAMSMPHETIPQMGSMQAMAEFMGVQGDVSKFTPQQIIDLSMRYQAKIRYEYADAMLLARIQ